MEEMQTNYQCSHTNYKRKRENAVSLIYLSLTFALEENSSRLPYYLGRFETNYIIFRNVENFKNYFFLIKILWKKIINI
jgi:hypothetical protein